MRRDYFTTVVIKYFKRNPKRMSRDLEQTKFLNLITPISNGHNLIRLGGNEDGGYWLPDDLSGVKKCISPGYGDLSNFEDELFELFKIKSLIVDSDVPKKNSKKHLTFLQKFVGGSNSTTHISLNEIMANAKGDYILQMDIEGAEFETLLALDVDNLIKFRIVVLELHGLNFVIDDFILNKVLFPIFTKITEYFDVVKLIRSTSQTFTNGKIRLPDTVEITFHRKDRRRKVSELEFNWRNL